MRIIFLEKSFSKCGGENFPRPFSKKTKLGTFLYQKSVYGENGVCFYCMPSGGLSNYTKTKLKTTCFYLMSNFFEKQKISLELVSLPHFLYDC